MIPLPRITALLAVATAATISAQATVYLTPDTADYVTGDHPSNPTIEEVQTWMGTDCDLLEAYKQNFGGNEEGGYAGSYTTNLVLESNDGDPDYSGGTIVWDGPLTITGDEIYFLVKDGNRPIYLFDISDWNGQETIDFSGFYLGQRGGSISHVSIYTCPSTNVPDGGSTVTLLGLGLGLLGLVARRRKA